MNIQEYISSGIVESYVLGLAEEAERVQFEQMCTLHAEVLAAREAFEIQLEQHAMAAAIAPPASLRANILTSISEEQVKPRNGKSAGDRPQPATLIFSLPMRIAVAACIVLLAGSAVLNIYYFNKYREFSSRYNQLLAEQTELAKNNTSLQTKLNAYENTIAGLTDPNMAVIKMDANNVPAKASPDPASVATVYWDTRSKDVYLMANNLPQPEAGKQYQLWAIVDNRPVDAGMLDISQGKVMVKMKNITRAQYFAITLERQGGSTSPEGKMYVMGKV